MAIFFSVMFSHCICGLAQRGSCPTMALLTRAGVPMIGENIILPTDSSCIFM